MDIRVGFGYDAHRLVEGRELWLGGVRLEHSRGLLGHSDADVLVHAVCDALLGAVAMGDIGRHFPDTAESTKGIDSKVLLARTMEIVASRGYVLGNVDVTVCAESPRLAPHVEGMRATLARVMSTDVGNVSIKATTTEGMGFTGRGEGMSAYAVALVRKG